ncbi:MULTISPECIES: ATP-binding protein [Photobacterium]|uniref:histidine kinase n=1 Tax=Photobacterium ganghwense TaxID=320778 RepID=A0A0J1K8W1_9GAMM|nr:MULTISPECIES: ATP-binding protein [Photobacterium]KLV10787.1 ATPase [Photobacterium ganghwense]MBV1842784.1 ATPase [Photobacterium ganghwense]PSU11041.1 ATP-binding protein [Photobacterium ganghwense]QSV13145.1 ATPase [Photobacterium ganghwense]
MKHILQPRLRRRVLVTSVAIIVLITSALAGVINQLYSQSYMAAYSSELVAQMPMVVAQLNRDGLIKDVDKWIDSIDPSDTDYMSVVCDKTDNTIWLSEEAKVANINNICSELPDSIPVPTLISTHNNESFIAYNVSQEREGGSIYQLVVLRSGDAYVSSLHQLHKRTTFYLGLFVLIAIAFLIAAFHWSFQPLRKLAEQLDEIGEANRDKLDNDFPMELQEVTVALNRLIEIGRAQKGRYRHAMDDLAHSLKTRLAATNALLDDRDIPRYELNQRIMEQISQMDELVQYQLKRAMMGQQGLRKDCTALKPLIDSFERLLSKVYTEKNVKLGYYFDSSLTLPVNRSDLMELLGNLLENAYRFCISEVRIYAKQTPEGTEIRIEDDGPGVPENMREAIFQRGVRADQLNPGQGIGLSVCHEIVMSYKGSIYIEPASIEGAAFVIKLPH